MNKYLILLGIILSPIVVTAQLHINCGGVNQTIPHFKADSVPFFNDRFQSLVKLNVVSPLKQSESIFEIRVLYYSPRHTTTVVLKCENNSISVDRYETLTDSRSTYYDTSYKNVGKIAPQINLFIKHTHDIKLKYPGTWNKFFKELIANRFFDLPKEDKITKVVLEKDPNGIGGASHGAIFLEVKVGRLYRNVQYENFYSEKVQEIALVQYQQNLTKLFYQFYK